MKPPMKGFLPRGIRRELQSDACQTPHPLYLTMHSYITPA